MLVKEDFKPRTLRLVRLRGGAVGGVHAGAAGLRRHPLRRRCSTRAGCSRRPADWFGGRTYPMQIAQLDAGLLIVFAFSGMTIIGAMLAGWSSANKFSLLGGAARRLADDLLRAGDGPDRARADPDLRHRRPGFDGAPAVGHGARRPAGLGRGLPALCRGAVPDRGHRREQAHPVRPARGRVRAHRRLLHRVQRDEDGPVHVRRVHRDRDRRRAVHHAVPRRLQPALHERRRLHAARRRTTSR